VQEVVEAVDAERARVVTRGRERVVLDDEIGRAAAELVIRPDRAARPGVRGAVSAVRVVEDAEFTREGH
jgi:hypothetical protein